MKSSKIKPKYQMKPNLGRNPFIFLIVSLTLACSMFPGCGNNSVTPREGALQGKVVDKAGNPVYNALVSWASDKTRWGRTSSEGTFHLDGVSFGNQAFLVEHPSFRTRSITIAIYSGTTVTADDIIVEAASFAYSEMKIMEVSATNALISWKTSDYTNGLIEYGTSESLGNTVRETSGDYSTVHTLEISGLKPDTKYYFRIVAARQNRSSETSLMYYFTTLSALEDTKVPDSPKGAGAALSNQPNQVTIFWAANSDSDLKGYKLYRAENPNSAFSVVSDMLVPCGQERYVDVGVVTGKKYHYRVTAVDEAGNESGPSETVAILVPGTITQDITWVRSNSPYFLMADIEIAETGTLRIDPGVEIEMADYDSFALGTPDKIEITVYGTLVADATDDVQIVFSSSGSLPQKADWSGLIFKNSVNSANILSNVAVAYADTGLAIDNSSGQFSDISFQSCNNGVIARNNTDLKLNGIDTADCSSGLVLTGNTNLLVKGCRFRNASRGIDSNQNNTVSFLENDFLDYTQTALTSTELTGTTMISYNLFVSATGLGVYAADSSTALEYNTFDSAYGIRIEKGSPIIRKNIVISTLTSTGTGLKGIEHLSGSSVLPIFGPNCVAGFAEGKDYIGCASSIDSLSEIPLFMKDFGNDPYDYSLYQGFPDGIDPWGMRRNSGS